jgi:hypothetical protein
MVIMKTDRIRDDEGEGLRYQVITETQGLLWQKHVYFGHNRRYRAGGKAFVEAAREQERQAFLVVN